MDDYKVGMIQFENNSTSLRLISMIEEMEKDRLAGWNFGFRKDYEVEQLKEKVKELEKKLRMKK